MKQFLSLILSGILILSLLGCGKEIADETTLPLLTEITFATEAPTEATVAAESSLPAELTAFGRVFGGTQAICRSASMEPIMIENISLFFTSMNSPGELPRLPCWIWITMVFWKRYWKWKITQAM